MKAYETDTHIMRAGRLVLKPSKVTLPLNDPVREARRYYADRSYRESLPCSECGKIGGCSHFPTEVAAMREP